MIHFSMQHTVRKHGSIAQSIELKLTSCAHVNAFISTYIANCYINAIPQCSVIGCIRDSLLQHTWAMQLHRRQTQLFSNLRVLYFTSFINLSCNTIPKTNVCLTYSSTHENILITVITMKSKPHRFALDPFRSQWARCNGWSTAKRLKLGIDNATIFIDFDLNNLL